MLLNALDRELSKKQDVQLEFPFVEGRYG